MSYRGRFAPSPTGDLHFGSLVAAVASFLDARHHQGQWLVRIEDLDPPREIPGSADRILRTLEAFGFEWDGGVLRQSHRGEAYRDCLDRLVAQGLCYRCGCTRSEVLEAGLPGVEGPRYPGTCRTRPPEPGRPHAYRLRTAGAYAGFLDRLQGPQGQHLESQIGDFVVRRSDGLYAYQLAVVVDDAHQGITQVVRGADLLRSTPRQIYLQGLCGLPQPQYAHVPLAIGPDGRKLSKQIGSVPVDPARPSPTLKAALAFLGQALPEERELSARELWRWASAHWDLARVPQVEALPIGQGSAVAGDRGPNDRAPLEQMARAPTQES